MATLLTKRLVEWTEEDETLEPLFAQWAFDKRLTAKALQNVNKLFPHYSRHDESHSIQILVNVERVLGSDRINQMSATDIWLLLEAAYLHDIGMVVSQKQQFADWADKDFMKFAKEQLLYATGEHKSVLEAVVNQKGKFEFFSTDSHPLARVGVIGQILAEFYRRQHADRASQIIMEPDEIIGLSSPRNELIPRRLFRLLGEICRMHGKSHAEIMTLPRVASGLGKDKIHPRFIACMLRLGDLLDVEDNRFCPVMLKVAGDLPASTHAHIDKHNSIRHLRVDSERIEVHAVCTTYEGFVETENWFNYLRDEIAWQMAHWADIVPANSFGLLPTIGDVRTELSGYELVENNHRPQFELDQPKVMELLQGAGLYENPRDTIRELVQNAIDATLMHVWLKHGESEGLGLPDSETIYYSDNPFGEKVKSILAKYPLRIDNIETFNDDKEVISVFLTIQDVGVGISRSDLAAMMKVGGSYKNMWKRNICDRMPIWMRPSGAFGIGLQSAFLLSDQIIFETRSILSREDLVIKMSDPAGREKGAIYIEVSPGHSIAKSCGTTVRLNIGHNAAKKFVDRRNRVDPLGERSPNYFFGILDNVFLPVILNGAPHIKERDNLAWDYYSDLSIAVAVDLGGPDSINYFFKSQKVVGGRYHGELPVKIFVNIFGDAEKILTVNRSAIRPMKADDSLGGAIDEAVARSLKSINANSLSDGEKSVSSLSLLAIGSPITDEYLKCRWEASDNYRRDYRYVSEASKKNFPTIEEVLSINPLFHQSYGEYGSPTLFLGRKSYWSTSHTISIFFQAAEHQGYAGYISSARADGVFIGFSKNKEAWDEANLCDYLIGALQPDMRLAIPVVQRFNALASMKWSDSLKRQSGALRMPKTNFMFSPFVMRNNRITTDKLDELIKWTFKNRIFQNTEESEIKELYFEFIRFVDGAMVGREAWVKKRG
jgi:hypothetical protein